MAILIAIVCILIFAIFSAVYVLRQKSIHGVPDAADYWCQQGFHCIEVQRFQGNDYLGREYCSRCGYVPKDQ